MSVGAKGTAATAGTAARVRRVGVVGLGLIGGSLALRLVARGFDVVAWNHTPRPYGSAERAGVRCAASLADLVAAAPDVIVLCNPLRAMPEILRALAALAEDGALDESVTLTDVGSVKGMVRDQVKAAGLADRYVGAHPMAGNEKSGWDAADPALYDDALWAVTVDEGTSYRRFLDVAELITAGVGDRMIVLDDGTHDRAAALISHMPHVVATALANELTESDDRNVAVALSAGCWRDMTRVALTDPDRTRAMVEEDAANVEALLRSMADRLVAVADLLRGEREQAAESRDADAHTPQAMLDFFADADPFRAYKAAQPGHLAAGDHPRVTVMVSADGWRGELLASARRGEHIVRIDAERTFTALVRSAL
ncbi:prephenate dehydrogenase [Bifidobacterium moraviense]|uniref:prephenate dehydrogenase n=1 Tax=Bifidobacterium moraviense TaxID=2675323 RepID=UPI00145D47D0